MSEANYILGLDLGVQSVGWAMIPCDANGNPQKGVKPVLGVRCFDTSIDNIEKWEEGTVDKKTGKPTAKPTNAKRRTDRGVRRNQWRRKRRTLKLFNILRNNGLLPMGEGPGDTPEERQELINELDKKLSKELLLNGDRVAAHLLPYKLRALGLDKKLEPFAFGRALLHLSQRRGFQSNKKAPAKDGEDEKGIKGEISDLAKEINDKGFRTLGEYFASLDPEERRIRQRWTGRDMFKGEFELLWNTQAKKHPALTEELKKSVHHALFFQRPLKSQKHLIGKCQLERGKRRAPLASMAAQRFRYWQKILDLLYRDENRDMVPLSPEQHDRLADALEHTEKLTFGQIRKLLDFKQPRLSKEEKARGDKPIFVFNLELDEDKGILGNRTSARIMEIIPHQWAAWSDDERDQLVDEILQFEHDDALARRLEKVYKFDANTAMQLAAVQLERDYAKLSKQAIRKLLPVMKAKRVAFATARKEIYGEQFAEDRKETLELLPPVLTSVKDLKNPVVMRTLTEVRKVVNAIIRKHGKPEMIRIELARDMKKSRKDREKLTKEMNDRRDKREEADTVLQNKEDTKTKKKDAVKTQKQYFNKDENKKYLPEDVLEELLNDESQLSIESPTDRDKLKWLLAVECNWQCPYTGKTITPAKLFGKNPQFDIEHTLPFSRSLDNSFVNKTLCYHEENRNVKKNMTPFEAYSNDPQKWHEIMSRVRKFRGPEKLVEAKLKRFQMEQIPEDFTSRMLNDTRYISKLACQYLGSLYGGTSDENGKQRIQASSGGMTAWLRDEWGMNSILNDGDEKNRNDHRHHAVDAAVIAMCDMGTVKKLSHAAERASEMGLSRRFEKDGIAEPVPNFKQIVSEAVGLINISFRANRKVSGGFHKDTNYSRELPLRDENGCVVVDKNGNVEKTRHERKKLGNMTETDIKDIVDKVVRKTVKAKVDQLQKDGKTVFNKQTKKATYFGEDCKDWPELTAKDGRVIPIKKARIRKTVSVLSLGKNEKTRRHVAPGNNHHMEIVAILEEAGNEVKWEGVIVSMFEAYQRKHRHEPIINRDHGPGKRFKFSLAANEYIERKEEDGTWMLWRVRKMSGQKLGITPQHDASPAKYGKNVPGKERYPVIDSLRKVHVDVLGDIHPAND